MPLPSFANKGKQKPQTIYYNTYEDPRFIRSTTTNAPPPQDFFPGEWVAYKDDFNPVRDRKPRAYCIRKAEYNEAEKFWWYEISECGGGEVPRWVDWVEEGRLHFVRGVHPTQPWVREGNPWA
ncbi:hypothetical protein ACLMJK_008427 [Lecanora helva]